MQDHKKLDVWRKAHRLAMDLERLLARMPRSAPPGLRNQCLRAASSVPTNIVEGCGAEGRREFVRYLNMAVCSSKELEYHVQRLHDSRIIGRAIHASLEGRVIEVRKMLFGLIARVRERAKDEP